jgi:peptidoglycan/LPS O-acetylase OafA/YrhL
VWLFFTLSGFLITNILLNQKIKAEEQEDTNKFKTLKSFYIRRTLRIFPIYYLTVLVLYLINFGNVRERLVWFVTYTINLYYFKTGALDGYECHFWSLAVEEQFYLIWPLTILLVPRRHELKTILTFIFIGILTPVTLLMMGYTFLDAFPLVCFSSLGAGALLSYYYCRQPEKLASFLDLKKNPLWIGSFVFFVFIIYLQLPYDRQFWVWKVFIQAAASFVFAWFVGKAGIGFSGLAKRILENKFLVYTGKISYGIYIYHIFVWVFLRDWLEQFAFFNSINIYLQFFIYFAATLAFASLSWSFVEKPINNLKNKFNY